MKVTRMRTDLHVLFLLLFLEDARRRLSAGVEVQDNGCWIWKRSGDGRYGHFFLHGTKFKAHVASQLLYNGRIPRGHVVRHACDTYACCCPGHLSPGTQKQNRADASERGRWAHGITKATVARIRNLLTRGHAQSVVAARVNVHPSTVSRIASGKMR